MWKNLSNLIVNLFSYLFTRLSKKDCKETWRNLEMRPRLNLENLEDLKKFQIKNL